MRGYYRNKETKEERIQTDTLKDGVVLNEISDDSGIPMGNSYYKIFVLEEDLKTHWEKFEWQTKLPEDKQRQEAIVKVFRTLMSQLDNYGILEDEEYMTDMEYECHLIEDAFFGEYKSKDEFHRSITRAVKQEFNEEMADEITFSESVTFFSMLYDIRNEVREALK